MFPLPVTRPRPDEQTLRALLDEIEALSQPWFAEVVDAVNRERYALSHRRIDVPTGTAAAKSPAAKEG